MLLTGSLFPVNGRRIWTNCWNKGCIFNILNLANLLGYATLYSACASWHQEHTQHEENLHAFYLHLVAFIGCDEFHFLRTQMERNGTDDRYCETDTSGSIGVYHAAFGRNLFGIDGYYRRAETGRCHFFYHPITGWNLCGACGGENCSGYYLRYSTRNVYPIDDEYGHQTES